MDVPLHTSPIGEKYKEFIILKKGLACNSKKWPSLSLSALHLFGDRGSDVIHEEFSYIEKSIIWETVQTSNDLARRNLADLREYCDLLIEKRQYLRLPLYEQVGYKVVNLPELTHNKC